MSVFAHPCFNTHEQVHFWNDPGCGLRAIAAIHRAAPNNAIGGCRMYPYANEDEALADVLKLARAMSYKCAMADIDMGGGKCVIIGDPARDKTPDLLRSMGRFIESLNGQYYTGEDVGIGISDVAVMRQETEFLVGREGADSSPLAGFGVYVGIKASLQHATGSDDLAGKTVAIQGLGQVGHALAAYLREECAELIVADVDAAAVQRAVAELGAKEVPAQDILGVECDVVAPCALGGIINEETLGRLKCNVIAGAANNQLANPEVGDALRKRGILYAPDYVINAGGVINNALTLSPQFSTELVQTNTRKIGDTLAELYARAEADATSTDAAAAAIAEERMAARDADLALKGRAA